MFHGRLFICKPDRDEWDDGSILMFVDDILNGFIVDFEDPCIIHTIMLYPPGNIIIVPKSCFWFHLSYTYILVVEESSRYIIIISCQNWMLSYPYMASHGWGVVVWWWVSWRETPFKLLCHSIPTYRVFFLQDHYKFPSFLNWIATASKTHSVIISWVQYHRYLVCDAMTWLYKFTVRYLNNNM